MSYDDTNNSLIGRTIVNANVNGHGITLDLDNGVRLEYHASDGGYSCWEFVQFKREGSGKTTRTIRFSHDYPKLHGQTTAKLLAVRPIRIDLNTPDELLEYDTTYYEKPFKDETSLYAEKRRFPLPTGDYIQLVFIGNLHIPFCTIRKAWPPQKVEYYKAAIGYDFAIHVKKEGGAE